MGDVTGAGQALLSVFDRIYIINLAERADRREEVLQQLARLGVDFDHPQVTLFPASRFDDPGNFPAVGVRGCYMSHVRVMKDALERGETRILLMEDDADFSRAFEQRITALARALAVQDWGVFYGWQPDHYGDAEDPGDSDLLEVAAETPVKLTHFMGFSRVAMATIVPFLETMAARPLGDPAGGPMNVDGAYSWCRAAHPEIVTLCTRTPIALQRPSRSDIYDAKWFDRIGLARPLVTALRRAKRALSSR